MKKVLVVTTIKGVAARNCLTGIFNYVNAGHDWSIRFVQDSDAVRTEDIRGILKTGTDGIIMSLASMDEPYSTLCTAEVPLVQIHDPAASTDAPKHNNHVILRNDDLEIGRLAARHFRNHGAFASYAFVPTGERTAWSVLRERGFRLELAKAHVVVATPRQNSLEEFLKGLPKPTAVFCATDPVAMDVVAAARRLHLKIPERLAVLGVDNDEMLCESCHPPLSSIRSDDVALGAHAAAELDRLMLRKPEPKNRPLLIPPRDVAVRESTRTVPPAARLIQEGLAFIKANATRGISVEDVAKHLGVSPELMRLRFRSIHGKSVRDLILDERLSTAKKLLKTTRAPLGEIAERSGFDSSCRLSHFFKERLGVSPRQFRAEN